MTDSKPHDLAHQSLPWSPRTAFCVVGLLRSLVDPRVYGSIAAAARGQHADVFVTVGIDYGPRPTWKQRYAGLCNGCSQTGPCSVFQCLDVPDPSFNDEVHHALVSQKRVVWSYGTGRNRRRISPTGVEDYAVFVPRPVLSVVAAFYQWRGESPRLRDTYNNSIGWCNPSFWCNTDLVVGVEQLSCPKEVIRVSIVRTPGYTIRYPQRTHGTRTNRTV